MSRFLTILSIATLVFSCEPIPLEFTAGNQVSVYSTFLNTGQPGIYIYYTAGVFEDSCKPVTNADIGLWEDEVLITGFENVVHGYGLYSKRGFFPKPGASYKMRVSIPGEETIGCDFEMPSLVTFKTLQYKIDSVVVFHTPEHGDTTYIDDSTFYVVPVPERDDTVAYVYLEIEINDPPGPNDFYGMYAYPGWIGFLGFRPLYDMGNLVDENEDNFWQPQFDDELLNASGNILKFHSLYFKQNLFAITLYHEFTGNIKNAYHPHYTSPNERDLNKNLVDIFKPETVAVPIIREDNITNGIGHVSGTTRFSDTLDVVLPPESGWVYHVNE